MQTGSDPATTAVHAAAVLPPELPVHQWRVGRCLGQGTSSSVWLVEQTGDGKRYALKIPLANGCAADGFELRRELAILSRYRHENLLGVEGVLTTDHGPGLLLEYAPGDSLARLVAARGTLSAGEAVTVLVAVGRALDCLHAEGAAHGDVAPGNVLFTANGKPLLADFGTGKLLAEPAGNANGTPGFSPPESPGPAGGPAADVYALGALGWFMLTGRPLVPGLRPPLSVLLPELPAALRDLVDSALEEDPELRPAAAAFAARALRACQAEPLDLLPAVHPSVRPELRTRRAAVPGAGRSRRIRERKRRTSRKRPWEDAAPGRPRLLPGRNAWLILATVLVAATAGLGAVAVLAPGVLLPGAGVPVPDAREAASPEPAARDAAAREPSAAPAADSTRTEPVPDPPVASGTPGEPSAQEQAVLRGEDPLAAAVVLAEVRGRAFEQGRVDLLDWVNQPGSRAEAADLEQVQALAERGERLAGFGVDVLRTSAVAGPSGAGARIAVSAQLSGWDQVRGDGSEAAVPGEPVRQEVILELGRTGTQWRIAAVLPAAASLQWSAGTER